MPAAVDAYIWEGAYGIVWLDEWVVDRNNVDIVMLDAMRVR